jgi:hypothetical protein
MPEFALSEVNRELFGIYRRGDKVQNLPKRSRCVIRVRSKPSFWASSSCVHPDRTNRTAIAWSRLGAASVELSP